MSKGGQCRALVEPPCFIFLLHALSPQQLLAETGLWVPVACAAMGADVCQVLGLSTEPLLGPYRRLLIGLPINTSCRQVPELSLKKLGCRVWWSLK